MGGLSHDRAAVPWLSETEQRLDAHGDARAVPDLADAEQHARDERRNVTAVLQ
jgi:hypothetical protein